MNKLPSLIVSLVSMLVAVPSFAQAPARAGALPPATPAPPPNAPAPSVGAPAAPPPPAGPAALPAPAVPAAPTAAPGATAAPAVPGPDITPPSEPLPEERPLPERVSELEGRVEGINESLLETKSTANSLAKLKFSGYIQGRYQWHDNSVSGVDDDGEPTNLNRFYVRRGRLKATYVGDNAEYMLQIDATQDGVVLRDAEATFVDTWTPLGLRLTVGQFKVPFGFEVLQSSSDREMPERAAVIRALFPGERDRGLRLQGRWEWLRFSLALVNGNFLADHAVYGTNDPNRSLDGIGRVWGDFGFLAVGLSGHYGEKLAIDPALATATQRYGLWRAGADAQLYHDIEGVGGLVLRGEFIVGRDSHRSYRGMAEDPCLDRKSLGWILTVVQNIGDHFGVVARLDQFDRDAGCPSMTTSLLDGIRVGQLTTIGGGVLVHVSGNLKATVVYEHPIEQEGLASRGNDFLTSQLQARF